MGGFYHLGRWELCAYNVIPILCLCLGHHFESSHAQAALAIYVDVGCPEIAAHFNRDIICVDMNKRRQHLVTLAAFYGNEIPGKPWTWRAMKGVR